MPGEGYLLSWDAGSGSCRCLVVDEHGRQVALSRGQTPTMPVDGVPGGLEFDHRQMWDTFVGLTREALQAIRAEDVLALSVSSFRDGMVFLDGQGEVLYAGTNRDGRAVAQGFEMAQHHGEAIYRRSGRWPVGIDGAAHLLWMRKFRPDAYQATARVLMVSDWLTYRLCGAFCSEPTNASSSLLFDVCQRGWSAEIAELLGLPVDLFPPLVAPGTVVGALSHQAATELGLVKGTLVVVGLADTQAACLACGAAGAGDTVAVAGTTMPLQMTMEEPFMDEEYRAWTGAHALDGRWSLECSAGLAGIALDWLWEAFGDGGSSAQAYALLSAEAETERPGSAMAFLGPWIADHSRLQVPRWVGFLAPFPMTLDAPLTRPKMARAVVENIAFALQGNLSRLEEISGRRAESLAVCGGLTRSKLFGQVVADVCQRPVWVPAVSESSALGAAMCAAVGAEMHSNLAQAAEVMGRGREGVEPDAALRGTYRTLYRRWLKTYDTCFRR